ncbi:MAG: orotate phosphoribosyltransferase, partial [Heliobacteriaceae bacterium]|nr:orotate phosphoribosyltransferase [Heliobacteriaceae bacterium]
MNNNILELLKQAEGVLHGHFCLTSGLHSNIYFQCAKLYQYPDLTEKIGKELAQKLSGVEFDTVVSPAIGAVIIGYETAKQAGKLNLFVERKDGKMELRRGYSLAKGEKVVIIEDVITTAKTIYETIDALKEFEIEVAAVGCIVDRTCGKTDLNIVSILQIDQVTNYPTQCTNSKEKITNETPG